MANRVVIGLNDGAWVARISKPGVNVLAATGLGSFYMHEGFASHRVLQAGSVMFAETSLTCSITYPNRGFVPIIFACIGDSDELQFPYKHAGNAIGPWNVTQAPTTTSCVFTRQTIQAGVYVHYLIFPMVN